MKRNYWLHRISHERGLSNVLLEKRNELSIGFSDFSDNKSKRLSEFHRLKRRSETNRAELPEGGGRT